MLKDMDPARPARVADSSVLLARVRVVLLTLVVLAMVGMAVDLLLLGHFEDAWQFPPLVVIGIGLCVAVWAGLSRSRTAMRGMQLTMLLFLGTGAAGVVLHYEGNSEFQREMDPALTGWPLFTKVIQAKAPPALAPAALMQIGLLGLLYTYRNGAASRDAVPAAPPASRSTP